MHESAHILVVDDDPQVLKLTKKFLGRFNLRVTTAADAQAAYGALEAWNINCVVLDVMLPGEDGYSILRTLRKDGNIPIIMLTAMSDDADRIIGLELGADDYLGKPFNPRELLARIRAVLRRTSSTAANGAQSLQTEVAFAEYILNTRTRALRTADGKTLSLTDREFSLLLVFVRNHGKVLSRDQLSDFVHSEDNDPLGRRIDLLVSRLRRKVETEADDPKIIQTVWGKGYRFCAAVQGVEV